MKMIALGNGACNALLHYQERCTHADVTFAYLNSDANIRWVYISRQRGKPCEVYIGPEDDGHTEVTKYKNGDCVLVIGVDITRYLGAGVDYETGIRAMESSKDEIMRLLKEDPQVILIGCCGGGVGSNIGLLADWAQQADTDFCAIYSMPFAFEGTRKRVFAEARIGTLHSAAEAAARKDGKTAAEHLCKIEYEDMDAHYERCGKRLTLVSAFEAADAEMVEPIERFYQSFSRE